MSQENKRSGQIYKDSFLKLQDTLSQEWIERAKELLGEVQDHRHETVEELREAVVEDPYLVQFQNSLDEGSCVRFLRAANWDIKGALELLRAAWMFGADFVECVEASLPSKLGPVWHKHLISCNPARDTRGRRAVILHRIGTWDPAVISPNEFLATALSLLEMLSREEKTQISGLNLILNAEGFSFKHLRYFGIHQVKCLAAILNGAVPLWFRSFHIVNHPRVFNMFFGIIKPFLNERIRDNIVFHSDLKSLHGDLQLDLLPPELGGSSTLLPDAEAATNELETEFLQHIETCRRQK